MIAVNRRTSQLYTLALIAVAATLALTIVAPSAQAQSTSYKTCKLAEREKQPSSGKPTYNNSLRHQRTRCATAKQVMNAFHRCRATTSFRCTRRLLSRWTCTSRQTSSIRTQFNATFTCKWGPRRVQSTFTQFRTS